MDLWIEISLESGLRTRENLMKCRLTQWTQSVDTLHMCRFVRVRVYSDRVRFEMQWQIRANGERFADLLRRYELQVWLHSDQRKHIRHFDGGGDRYLVIVLGGQFVVENHLSVLLDLANAVLRKRLVVRILLFALHQLKHFKETESFVGLVFESTIG